MNEHKKFTVSIEIVPPQGSAPEGLLKKLGVLKNLPFDRFNVASNPVAKPCMSALAMCLLLREQMLKNSTLHCTTRDHNRLSLQSLLWGAKALDLHSVLVMTGDFVALGDRASTTTVRDLDVFELIHMSRASGILTGVVFESGRDLKSQERAIKRLEKKVASGAQFVVTQPVYDTESVERIISSMNHIEIPKIIGILPLYSAKHAEFLHQKVSGIQVPQEIRDRMNTSKNQNLEGIINAREIFSCCRQISDGVCLMPAFNHFEVIPKILEPWNK